MKTTILLILTGMLASCDIGNMGDATTDTSTSKEFKVRKIDGCEYLEYDRGILDQRVYSLTHKGDCKSPIHQHNSK